MFWRTKAGSTSVMLPGRAYDTSGARVALAYNTAGIAASYRREGSSSFTAITPVTATAGSYTSSGIAVAGSGATGAFELHAPNAAFAAGAKWVEIELSATGVAPMAWFVALDAVDYQDTVRFGLTALLNAAAGAAGGIRSDIRATGTAGGSSTTTRIYLGTTSSGTDWSRAIGSLIRVGNETRVITSGNTGEIIGENEYVDVTPAFIATTAGAAWTIFYDIAGRVDSSLYHLLSSGTGAGQITLTSGQVTATNGGGGGGDATAANQAIILDLLQSRGR